jgi:hypothetical protein
LLKCIFLNRHPEIIKGGKIEDKRFKSHDLMNIACDYLKLTLSENEKFLCELGTKAILWFGRYPIPLKDLTLLWDWKLTGQKFTKHSMFFLNDW